MGHRHLGARFWGLGNAGVASVFDAMLVSFHPAKQKCHKSRVENQEKRHFRLLGEADEDSLPNPCLGIDYGSFAGTFLGGVDGVILWLGCICLPQA